MNWLAILAFVLRVWTWLIHRSARLEGEREQQTKDLNATNREDRDARAIEDNISSMSRGQLIRDLDQLHDRKPDQ